MCLYDIHSFTFYTLNKISKTISTTARDPFGFSVYSETTMPKIHLYFYSVINKFPTFIIRSSNTCEIAVTALE